MIKFLLSFFWKERHTKIVMIWDGRQVEHWKLTDNEYKKLMTTVLPMGISILAEMEI
jgi:hypothetical protein